MVQLQQMPSFLLEKEEICRREAYFRTLWQDSQINSPTPGFKWAKFKIQSVESELLPPSDSQRSPLSPPATEALSITPPSSNSLHVTHHYWWQLFTICLPHLPHEFSGTQSLFLSLSLLHLQWLKSYSVKEGANEKKIHKRTSDKTELTDSASLKLPPETERLHTFQCVIGWI